MAGEFFQIAKEVASRKKEICVKLIYSIKTNTIISFFSKFLVKFLRNSIKYAVSRVVLGALSGALRVALLRAMALKIWHFLMIPLNESKNEYPTLKLIG